MSFHPEMIFYNPPGANLHVCPWGELQVVAQADVQIDAGVDKQDYFDII